MSTKETAVEVLMTANCFLHEALEKMAQENVEAFNQLIELFEAGEVKVIIGADSACFHVRGTDGSITDCAPAGIWDEDE